MVAVADCPGAEMVIGEGFDEGVKSATVIVTGAEVEDV